MTCPKCHAGEKHGTKGQVSFTITLTTGAIGCSEPVLLLEKLKAEIEREAKTAFKVWTVTVDNGSYEPYKKN